MRREKAIAGDPAGRLPRVLGAGRKRASRATARRALKKSGIVDPVDGTFNFIHGYPAYSVSVARGGGGPRRARGGDGRI
jgi:hypothetical protein